MPEFVTLSCPTCSGKLDITEDIERFACGYCGNEHVVRRGGGIISLIPIADDIKGIKTGVDKTSAELGIIRLKKELEELEDFDYGFKSLLCKYEHKGSDTGLVFEVGSSIALLIQKRDNEKLNNSEIKKRINALNSDDVKFLARSLPQFNKYPRYKESTVFQSFLSGLLKLHNQIEKAGDLYRKKLSQLTKLYNIVND